MEKVNRTKEELLQYLKDANTAQGIKGLQKIAEELVKMVEKLDMQKPDDRQKLLTAIVSDLGIKNVESQNGLVKFLTGYSRENENPEVEKTDKGLSTELEELDDLTVRDRVNKIIDKAVLNSLTVGTAATVGLYRIFSPEIFIGKALVGTISFGVGAVTGIASLAGLEALKLGRGILREGTKIFKAALGTAAKAMHKKTLQKLRATQRGIIKQEQILKDVYEERSSDVDSKAAKLGLQDEEFYKRLIKLRPEKGENGALKYGKLDDDKVDGCKKVLASEYKEVSEQRDTQLIIMANADTYKVLTEKLSIEPNKAVEIIRDGIYIDETGKLMVDSEYDISLDGLSATELGYLNKSIQTMSILDNMTEIAKQELSESIELKDGKVQVKDEVDMSEVNFSTEKLLSSIADQEASIDENLFAEYMKTSAKIDLLIDCERELIIGAGIRATQEMAKTLKDKSADLRKQKGVLGTMGEKVSLWALRQRAEAIVESRQQSMISPLIGKHADASRKLMELATERLTPEERGAYKETDQPKKDIQENGMEK